LWKTVGDRVGTYKAFPRLVGETGGKDFVFVHRSADLDAVAVALVRGAFEYQGQKCSAASRVYAPASLFGALISRDVNDRVLLGIFALLSLVTAAMLLLPVESQQTGTDDLDLNVPLAVGISIVLGFLGGMVGIGAIATIIGTLVYLLRVPPRIAIGTSLGIGMFSAVAALIGKAATAQVDPPLAAIVAVLALVASPIGAWVSIRTQPAVLMKILAVVVIVAALRMAATAILG